MSYYTTVKVKFSNTDTLVKALLNLGFKRGELEVFNEAAAMIDYQGNKTHYRYKDTGDIRFKDCDKAHVIIRAKNVGNASNDIGFYLDYGPAGSVALIDDYTRGASRSTAKNPVIRALGGFGDVFLSKVAQEYAVESLVKNAAAKCKTAHRVECPDGRVKVFVGA